MAWQVALILDTRYSVQSIGLLARQMPVWAIDTEERRAAARGIRAGADAIWEPEPSFTLFKSGGLSDGSEVCRFEIPAILQHHPNIAALQLIGISASERPAKIMLEQDFVPAVGRLDDSLAFRRPIDRLEGVRELVLDASQWATQDNIYDSFFAAVGAPSWHGRNFNALSDSIVAGGINRIEVPYRILVQNFNMAGEAAQEPASQFIDLVRGFEAEGCPVAIQIEDETRK